MRTACLPLAALAVLTLAPPMRAQERSAPAPQPAAQPAADPAQRAGGTSNSSADPGTSPEAAGRMAATEAWRRTLLARRAEARGEQPPQARERPLATRRAPSASGAEGQLPSRAERLAAAAGRAPAAPSAKPERVQQPSVSESHRVPAGSQAVGGRGPTTLQHGVPLYPVLMPRPPAAPAADPAGAAAPAADAPAEAPASPAPSDAGSSPR
ncbi:MAG TPA: hypothetical protein VFY71_10420 [Planctomycetota bacterium]|nr:hypothetical protein [Planctomycetota bacterium]